MEPVPPPVLSDEGRALKTEDRDWLGMTRTLTRREKRSLMLCSVGIEAVESEEMRGDRGIRVPCFLRVIFHP
jgi:hypothetical protein